MEREGCAMGMKILIKSRKCFHEGSSGWAALQLGVPQTIAWRAVHDSFNLLAYRVQNVQILKHDDKACLFQCVRHFSNVEADENYFQR
jgi:hypothetical protein